MPETTQVRPSAPTASDLLFDDFPYLMFGDRRASLALLAAEWCHELNAEGCAIFVPIPSLAGPSAEPERLRILGYPPRSTYHKWAKQAREHAEFTLDADVVGVASRGLEGLARNQGDPLQSVNG